jgi:CBS domain-containing protein
MAREQPVNAEIRALLENTTLGEMLQQREGWSSRKPLVLDADASVSDAMEALYTHKVSSLPVLASGADEARRSGATALFFGFFDVPCLLQAFFDGKFVHGDLRRDSQPGTPDAPPPSHTQTAESLSSMPARLQEDQPLVMHPRQQPMLSQIAMLNALGPQFANMTLRHITPGRDGELLYGAATNHSLLHIITDGLLNPPAAGLAAVHRIAVFDFGAQGGQETPLESTTQPIRILSVLSQSDIIRWLAKQMGTPGALGLLPEATRRDLRLVPKPVVCVGADDPTLEALDKILKAGLPAAGVVNEQGHLVGALELADLKGIMADKLGTLALPVGEFLALRHQTVWSSCHGASALDEHGLARRETMLQQHTLVRCAPHDTFGQLLHLFLARHARCVFVTDADSMPLSVVTPTDIMRIISAEPGPGVPTKKEVSLAPPDPTE